MITEPEYGLLVLNSQINAAYKLQRKLMSEMKIKRNCTHSETEDLSWCSDDGYGKQTKRVGKRCKACRSTDLFSTGHWEYIWDDEEL